MPAALWKKFSKDEIISIIENSASISDLIKNLGYSSERKKTKEQINKMLEFYNLPPFTSDDYKNKNEIEKEKICEICGKTFIVKGFGQASRKYCFECSPSTNNPTTKTRAMKKKVIEMKGGKCERCGYNKCLDALELHHLDPSTKDYQLSNTGGAPSFDKFLAEAEKCILLCANCHREEHWRLRQEKEAGN